MNSFVRRLKYYGIGFGIGLVFVFFFFKNRGCSWLPENRVKNTILDRVIVVSEDEQIALSNAGLTSEDVMSMLNDGDVSFDKSDKHRDPQVYVIEKDIKGKTRRMMFTLPKESFISELKFNEKDAFKVKNTLQGFGQLIHFPKDENLVYCDTTQRLTCQQDAAGLIDPKKILSTLKDGGRIDFAKSNLKLRPKAEHYLLFVHNNDTIGAQAIWYQNKITISELILPFDTDCK